MQDLVILYPNEPPQHNGCYTNYNMYLLGYDIGSSSIKAALVCMDDGQPLGWVQSPGTEMGMAAPQLGWAEQAPEAWWEHVCLATRQLLANTGVHPRDIVGIGIAYQMHGLVCVDKYQAVLRPSIIWCDSRAVSIGNQAFEDLGADYCLPHLLNAPGNFTASKLAWVKAHEPSVFEKTYHFMLPGDYIAMRLTGEVLTTPSGLSEGILWDFKQHEVSEAVLRYFGFERSLVPPITPALSLQGTLTVQAAAATGLRAGIPVSYRAGDQPNNALCLNVLQPGEIAATGGTSGVVYGIVDEAKYDPQSRVNSFAHVNHAADKPRIGILLCINGAGIQYSWAKHQVAEAHTSYADMEARAASVPPGADGLRILPFGNGAERMLNNAEMGAVFNNLHFNRHTRAHLYRAALEGIAFSFVYGMKILKEMGLEVKVMRVGNDNLFQSGLFSQTIANLVGSRIELVETTGAVGAAKAAGVATGYFGSIEEAMQDVRVQMSYEPEQRIADYEQAYGLWAEDLARMTQFSNR